mmetsp:Transcript_48945/g.106551  ORF Transcript_48945/g.106551 Transcript_48945/m.106551 type:complete len:343 (+) Transcript_48945:26-1054(+)
MAFSMKMQPKGPKPGSFGGFKMAVQNKVPAKPKAVAKAPAPVVSLFAESMEKEDETADRQKKIGMFQTVQIEAKSKQAELQAAALIAEDPTVFQYDEVIEVQDDTRATRHALPQERAGVSQAKAAPKRQQSRYVETIKARRELREKEHDLWYEKRIQREREDQERTHGKAAEVFVTSAYKEHLAENKSFAKLLEERDAVDAQNAVENKLGFSAMAGFHRNLLDRGMASSTKAPEPAPSAPAEDEPTADDSEAPAGPAAEGPATEVPAQAAGPAPAPASEPEAGEADPGPVPPPAAAAVGEKRPREAVEEEAPKGPTPEEQAAAVSDAKARYLARKKAKMGAS